MALKYKTRAFVFRKNDVNESDRNFSVFTDDYGRLEIFAKAIRKSVSKLRSGIDIFSMSEIEFIQGKNRKTLTDAAIIKKFNNVPLSLEKFEVANKIAEILDNFIKGEAKDQGLFDLINQAIDRLNSHKPEAKSQLLIYYYFLWNFFSLLGYKPEVHKCASCQEKLNPYNIYFSSKDGGIICKKCLDKEGYPVGHAIKINSDIVKILRLIFKKDWQILSKLKIEASSQKLFQKISENYYSYILSSHSFKK